MGNLRNSFQISAYLFVQTVRRVQQQLEVIILIDISIALGNKEFLYIDREEFSIYVVFIDWINNYMNVLSSPALSNIRLYPLKEIFLVFLSVRGWVELRDILRPERLGWLKFPVTSSGIQTANFLLVLQCIKYPQYYVINCTGGLKIYCVLCIRNMHYSVHSACH